MKLGISVKIDVTKLLKERFFKGEKGTYADLTTFIDLDELDQYGNNGFISQSVTKQEREAKFQTPILGNVKVFFNDSGALPQSNQQESAPQKAAGMSQSNQNNDFDDDIPFR